MGDIQDIRYIGGLIIGLPIISIFFIGASLALCGIPFLAGFYSKDVILEVFFISSINSYIFFVIFFSTILTITYSFRLVYYLFFKNMGVKNCLGLREELGMSLPMSILFIFSVTMGSLLTWFSFPIFTILIPFISKVLIILGLFIFFMYILKNIRVVSVVKFYSLKIYSFFFWYNMIYTFFVNCNNLSCVVYRFLFFEELWSRLTRTNKWAVYV